MFRVGQPIELVDNALQFVGGYSLAVVPDFETYVLALGPYTYVYLSASGAVLAGVRNQVGNHLAVSMPVNLHHARLLWQFEMQRLFFILDQQI
jgi:hypothetical protein